MKNTLKTIAIASALLITQQALPAAGYFQAGSAKLSSFWNTYAPAKPDFSGLAAKAASYMPDMSAAKATAAEHMTAAKAMAADKLAQANVKLAGVKGKLSEYRSQLPALKASAYEAGSKAAESIKNKSTVAFDKVSAGLRTQAARLSDKAQAGFAMAQGQWNRIPEAYRPFVVPALVTTAVVAKLAHTYVTARQAAIAEQKAIQPRIFPTEEQATARLLAIEAMAYNGTLEVRSNDVKNPYVFTVAPVQNGNGFKLRSTTLNEKGQPMEVRRVNSFQSLLDGFTVVPA